MKKLLLIIMTGFTFMFGLSHNPPEESMNRKGETGDDPEIVLRIALMTDIHYADKPGWSDRNYSKSLEKARQAVATFNELGSDFLVLLGDIIDEVDQKMDIANLEKVDRLLAGFRGVRHYVPGNHDLGAITKEEFLASTGGAGSASWYSFSRGGYHFIVLDGNFRQDGTAYCRGNFEWTDSYIPADQLSWLGNELELSKSRGMEVIIFMHQNLCDENDPHGVKNAGEIREILERSGNVQAVFQGHKHSGGYKKINGIHYIGLHPLVVDDTNAFAELVINRQGRLTLHGYGRQPAMELK